jgi:hypothetical protein
LGNPIHFWRLTNAEWKIDEERLQLRLSSWKGKLLSIGGRLVLINLVLSNMVPYMLSLFLLPKGVLIGWIFSDQDSFGKATAKRKNIGWLSGVWFAGQKTNGD